MEDLPIMKYVHELEGKVRVAKEETAKYRSLAFFTCLKSVQWWLGIGVGLCIAIAFYAISLSIIFIMKQWHIG